jgi:hypothetical protein
MRAIIVLIALLTVSGAQAAVLNVPGDHADIQAAIDAGAPGDVVLIAAGTYPGSAWVNYGGLSFVADGTVVLTGPNEAFYVSYDDEEDENHTVIEGLRFEGCTYAISYDFICPMTVRDCVFTDNDHCFHGCGNGPLILENCRFEANHSPYHGAALYPCLLRIEAYDCSFVDNTAVMAGGAVYLDEDSNSGPHLFERCLFTGNSAPTGAALASSTYNDAIFMNCVFWGNQDAAAIQAADNCSFVFENCVVSDNGGAAFDCPDGANLDASCTVVHGNVGGNWTGCATGLLGVAGNTSFPPFFCDPAGGDFQVSTGSYCLPENNSCGVLIGLHGEGCVLTGVPGEGAGAESNSWGGIKALY